jgi:hypothetical protein
MNQGRDFPHQTIGSPHRTIRRARRFAADVDRRQRFEREAREGSSSIASRRRTQTAAEGAARSVARREPGEVIMHRPDGRIRDRDSYWNDPTPPRDRKH